MDSDISRHGYSTDENIGFEFNNCKFSDRLLRIEIMGVPSDSSSDDAEECKIIRVKEVHISSPILAAKSPFFDKLFSNGMKESEDKCVTLRIEESEEAAFMELLKFMYSNVVSVDTTPALLDVLMVADKFEVASCMSFCCKLFNNLPMTDAAKQFLAAHYTDITKYCEEVMSLPLEGIEVILSSDDLQAESEDEVYEFMLKWARVHYPLLEERREILGSRLARLIRLPFMTSWKLGTVLACPDFKPEIASKLIQETLFSKGKGEVLNSQASLNRHYIARAYKFKPIKMIEFDLPDPECEVYMDLKREECAGLFPSGQINSQPFYLEDRRYILSARCSRDNDNSFECFGLFLEIQEQRPAGSIMELKFSALSKLSDVEFETKFSLEVVGQETFTGDLGCRNLFEIPWASFIGDDSEYFINDLLCLKASITIKR